MSTCPGDRINPLSPRLRSLQRRPQAPHAKSKFLAAELSEELGDAALDAAAGPTTVEAENAFALSVIETGGIDPGVIAREKANALQSNGLLEIVATTESADAVGGLDQLKGWLEKRRNAFGQAARDYGLPSPKGLMIIGIPGTGKSRTLTSRRW